MSVAASQAALSPQPAATTVDELAQCTARLAAYLDQNRPRLRSEAAAKIALVQPFIRALGYNVNDLSEVVPEFTADHGLKKGEKVDFALMRGDAVALLVECKTLGAELSIAHCGQLSRYFHNTDASFGLLTDGNRYRFYSDLEKPNVMDDRPSSSFDSTLTPVLTSGSCSSSGATASSSSAIGSRHSGSSACGCSAWRSPASSTSRRTSS